MLVQNARQITAINKYEYLKSQRHTMRFIPLTSNCRAQIGKRFTAKMCLRNINCETISHNENIQHNSMERQLSMLCRDDII